MLINKKILSYIIPLLIFSQYTHADTFNINALNLSGHDNIDLSHFENNDLTEGLYIADIELNGKKIIRGNKITFVSRDDLVVPCITSSIIDSLLLTEEALNGILLFEDSECALLTNLDPNITIEFHDDEQVLAISIPQKYLESTPTNWVSPTLRNNGIAGLILDYNVMNSHYRAKNQNSKNNLSLYGNVGANISAWRFRANYQYRKDLANNTTTGNDGRFEWEQVYAFRDLAEISAKLFLGEVMLKTDLFDSVRFKGISIFTDESMMPPNLRGYAPQITGVATSNATVTLSQNGRILQQLKVPAGPFVIKDLNQSVNGTIDVTVTEDNGNETTFQVTTTSIPFLTRKGEFRYKLNSGQLAPNKGSNVTDKFISLEGSVGILNNTSLFGGVFSTQGRDYQAINIGIGQNLIQFGALSFDITQSQLNLTDTQSQKGKSYRINYAKDVPSINGQITLTGYRFADRHFNSLSNFITQKESRDNTVDNFKDKHVVSLSYSQQLPSIDASVSITGSQRTYWNGGHNNYVSIALNKYFTEGWLKGSSMSLSLNQSKSNHGKTDNQVYLAFNKRFSDNNNAMVSYFGSHSSQNKKLANNLSYSDKFNSKTHYNIGTSAKDGLTDTNVNAYLSHDSEVGQVQVSGTVGNDITSGSALINGSMTLTSHGLSMHPQVYRDQSRLLVDIPSVKGVSIDNGNAVTNRYGIATLNNVPSYYRIEYAIDINALPKHVNIEDNIIETTLTDGSIGYIALDADIGQSLISRIKLQDGQYPPFGASVYNITRKKPAGIIAETGIVYLVGLNHDDELSVNWGQQSCMFPANALLNEKQNHTAICQ